MRPFSFPLNSNRVGRIALTPEGDNNASLAFVDAFFGQPSSFQISSSDSLAVTTTEATTAKVSVSSTETVAVSIAEASFVALLYSSTDNASVALSETSQVTVARIAIGSDGLNISLSEAVGTAVSLARNDIANTTTADSSLPHTRFASTDSPSVSVGESSAVSLIITSTDTAAVAVDDESLVTLLRINFRQIPGVAQYPLQSNRLGRPALTTEDHNQNVTPFVSYFFGISLGSLLGTEDIYTAVDSNRLTVFVSSSDSLALTISVAATLHYTVITTDSLNVSIADQRLAQTSVSLSLSDSLNLTLDSTLDTGFRSLSSSESLAVTFTETSKKRVQATSDTDNVTVTDATKKLLVRFSSSDTISPTFLEMSSTGNHLFHISSTDTINVACDDTSALNTDPSTKTASIDTAAITINDSSQLTVLCQTTDTTNVAVDDGSIVASTLSRTDSVAVNLSDLGNLPSLDLIRLHATESTSIAVFEATTDSISISALEAFRLTLPSATTDGLAVFLQEQSAIVVTTLLVRANDTVAPSFSESSHTVDRLSRTDRTDLAFGEVTLIRVGALIKATLGSSDTVSIVFGESSRLTITTFAFPLSSADRLDVTAVNDGSAMFNTNISQDTERVSVTETTALHVSVTTTDTLGLRLLQLNTIPSPQLDSLEFDIDEVVVTIVVVHSSDTTTAELTESAIALLPMLGMDVLGVNTTEASTNGVVLETTDIIGVIAVTAYRLTEHITSGDEVTIVVVEVRRVLTGRTQFFGQINAIQWL